jgi:L-ribulose-5-phosphate 3-epimerase
MNPERTMTRRAVLAVIGAAPLAAAVEKTKPVLCIFSKHMAKLNYQELGKTAKDMGFGGVDLTVRKAGHVLPARAAEDMPKAVDTLRAHGLAIPMITTELLSASDPSARPILATAAKLKIPRYKLGYWKYDSDVLGTIAKVKESVTGLCALNKEIGIEAGYHNHSGNNVGEAIWDIRAIINDLDPKLVGYYFDACHATAEGGVYGWHASLDMAAPRIKMIAVKDFFWEKSQGKWKMTMCPMGQGMVDWPAVFAKLAQSGFNGPISLHMEYTPADEMEAIASDFVFLKKQVAAAWA